MEEVKLTWSDRIREEGREVGREEGREAGVLEGKRDTLFAYSPRNSVRFPRMRSRE